MIYFVFNFSRAQKYLSVSVWVGSMDVLYMLYEYNENKPSSEGIMMIGSTPDRGSPVSLGLGLLENFPEVEAPLPRQLRGRPPHVLAVIAGFLSCQFKLVNTCKMDESPERGRKDLPGASRSVP